MPELGLGTVQFGLDYGVSNARGKTPRDEGQQILDVAHRNGVRVLDTAAAYGESEAVLGELVARGEQWRVVTKLEPLDAGVNLIEQARASLSRSLERLEVESVYGLMVHRAQNLLDEGSDRLWRWMQRQRDLGILERIGASVYHPEQAERLLQRFDLDLIQLPMSVFDQRFEQSGVLAKLDASGVEIHARSVFLQGLLLMGPTTLDPYFAPIRPHLEHFHDALDDEGLTPVEAALGYAFSRSELDVVIVGVNNVEQLQSNLDAIEVPSSPDDVFWRSFALEDERWTNPANWKLSTSTRNDYD